MIRVLHNYGGRNTQERRIEPGLYREDDTRLFGLAAYLVTHGHAVIVPDEDLQPVTTTVVRGAVVLLPDTPVNPIKEYIYEPVKDAPVSLTTAPGGDVLVLSDDVPAEDEQPLTDLILNEGEPTLRQPAADKPRGKKR